MISKSLETLISNSENTFLGFFPSVSMGGLPMLKKTQTAQKSWYLAYSNRPAFFPTPSIYPPSCLQIRCPSSLFLPFFAIPHIRLFFLIFHLHITSIIAFIDFFSHFPATRLQNRRRIIAEDGAHPLRPLLVLPRCKATDSIVRSHREGLHSAGHFVRSVHSVHWDRQNTRESAAGQGQVAHY
jgi:hypothetical protein